MRRKIVAGLILILLAVSGCGERENTTEEQRPTQNEDETGAETISESVNLEADETDADSRTFQDDAASDVGLPDMNQTEIPEADGETIEGNGSYFVRIGTDVYFRTYEPDAFAENGMDGDFLSYAFAGDDTSSLCRYDDKTGDVSVVTRDGCTGRLYWCGDRFYYDNVSDIAVWTSTLDGVYERFCPGNVAGVSDNSEYIALWQDIGDDGRSIHVYDGEGNECNFLSTADYMQVIFCGVTDDGDIIFIGTDTNEETGLYSCIAGLHSETIYLGAVPLENIFVDISCDNFFTRGDDVYCVIGYYGGPVLTLESYLYVRMRADEPDSMEVLEQGEKSESLYSETLYLTHSIFGSKSHRKFIYGDLLYRDDNMQENVLVKNFIPYMDREHLIMQTGEVLGDYAYVCVAEAERNPDEDYKVLRAYSYEDMYYLRIPVDGNEEIESIYGPSWDDALDFSESVFSQYVGEWKMDRMVIGEEPETSADREVTAIIKDDVTLTIRDESEDTDEVYVLSNLMDDEQHTSVWYNDYYSWNATGMFDGDELVLDLPIQLSGIDDPRPASWKGYFSRLNR